jgi:probable addiction module antidote protein
VALKTTPFDPSEHLDDSESIAAYLDEAIATGDPRLIAKTLGVIARARGMTQIAQETGLSRESLYRALSDDGNPEFSTLLAVVSALGLQLTVTPKPEIVPNP